LGPHTILGDTMVGGGYLGRFDQQGKLLWARSPGGSDVAAADGNVAYVAGSFTGTLAFGATTLTANGMDAYLAKYDASGTLLWVHQIGGPGLNNAYAVAVDGTGMVHVAGHFQGTASFGGTTLVATHDSTGYVATYTANGVDQWAALCGGLDASPSYISPLMSIDCDAAGNTFVSGVFDNTGTFGSTTLAAVDFDDIYLTRFDASGVCTWVRGMGSQSGNEVQSVGVTPTGNVFVYGAYYGESATFCGPALPNSDFGHLEMFLAMYDGGGTCQWAQRVAPCFFNDSPGNLDVDGSGNAWITGYFTCGSGQFGSLTLAGSGQFVARYDQAGNATLAEQLTTATFALIGLGTNNDIYLCGSFYSGVFDQDAGTDVFPRLNGSVMGYIAHYDAAHEFNWIQQIGPHGAAYDLCSGIALDAGGNVYTTGYYSGSAIFCSDTLHAWMANSTIFLNKRDADGNCLWTRSIGDGADGGLAFSIAVDDGENIYITGSFADSLRFGNTLLVSAGGTDLFLAKYDVNGNCLWVLRGGGTGNDRATSVAADTNGEPIIAGEYAGTAIIAGSTFTSLGSTDGFMARYDAEGSAVWSRTMGGTGWDNVNDVTVDGSGNSYAVGRFTTAADFGPLSLDGTGDADLFLAKYGANGDPLWVVGTTGTGWKEGSSVVQNQSGKVYVTGSFSGTADFCTSDLVSDANYQTFLGCYDPGGDELWVEQFQTSGESHGYGLSARPAGNIVLTGSLYGTMTFGGTTLTSISYGDVIVAAFEPDGTALWAKSMGGTGAWDFSSGQAVATDADIVYVAGIYGSILHDASVQGGSITFEAGDPLTTLFAPNASDAFLVKYGSNETTNIPADPLGCDGVSSIHVAGTALMNVSITPNPVDRFFTITGAKPIDPRTGLVVQDGLGRVVNVPFTISQASIEVDATTLVPGAYTITLFTSAGTVTRRFAKH
ncbi:MAG: T9SS type A sorting domain-containing protein, partial [Flavobacteriales bacterium]